MDLYTDFFYSSRLVKLTATIAGSFESLSCERVNNSHSHSAMIPNVNLSTRNTEPSCRNTDQSSSDVFFGCSWKKEIIR